MSCGRGVCGTGLRPAHAVFADQRHPTDGVWELHGHLRRHALAGSWHVSHVNVKDGGGRESNCQWLPDNTGGWQESELVNDF